MVDIKDTAGGVRVGSATAELAADDSMVIAGGIGPRYVEGQEGKLRAVATVIEGADGTRVAIVACDILMIRREYLDAAADRIEGELGIPASNVLINATHTHHAPATVNAHGYDGIEIFGARVRDGVIEAVRKACQRVEDQDASRCQMLFRLGEESTVGQNSRLLLEDGTVYWVGPRDDEIRPTGPFDPELPVIAFRREDGGYESVIFNHSTHCIGALSPGKRSPAFYGLAAQELEDELGGSVTFISGAAGSTHNLALDTKEMINRIKAAVKEALQHAQPRPVPTVRSLKLEFTYEIREFDEEKEDAAVVAYCTKRLQSDADFTIDVFRKTRRELAPHQGGERKTWLQVIRIGDIALVGVPGEFFTELGIEIKRRSPFRNTFVAGLANDNVGYIPDAQAYDLGGYQVWTGRHSQVMKGTGEEIVRLAVKLLDELRE